MPSKGLLQAGEEGVWPKPTLAKDTCIKATSKVRGCAPISKYPFVKSLLDLTPPSCTTRCRSRGAKVGQIRSTELPRLPRCNLFRMRHIASQGIEDGGLPRLPGTTSSWTNLWALIPSGHEGGKCARQGFTRVELSFFQLHSTLR